jgi:hypothetical protein
MNFKELLEDKTIKSKEKTGILSQWILDNTGEIDEEKTKNGLILMINQESKKDF